ncbi:MAG: hypothetical protein HQK51_09115 [Oligoflexia bacterium]|nr:hypothetical protein [Oligoflexia bacterium]
MNYIFDKTVKDILWQNKGKEIVIVIDNMTLFDFYGTRINNYFYEIFYEYACYGKYYNNEYSVQIIAFDYLVNFSDDKYRFLSFGFDDFYVANASAMSIGPSKNLVLKNVSSKGLWALVKIEKYKNSIIDSLFLGKFFEKSLLIIDSNPNKKTDKNFYKFIQQLLFNKKLFDKSLDAKINVFVWELDMIQKEILDGVLSCLSIAKEDRKNMIKVFISLRGLACEYEVSWLKKFAIFLFEIRLKLKFKLYKKICEWFFN